MAYFTPPLMNEEFTKKLFSKPEAHYYLAAHKEEGAILLWFETKILGKTGCYPCIIRGDDMLELPSNDDPDYHDKTSEFAEQWEALISPGSLSDFVIKRIEKERVKEIFARLRDVNSDIFPLYEELGMDLSE